MFVLNLVMKKNLNYLERSVFVNKSISELLDVFIITFNRAKALDKTLAQILDEKSPIKDFEIQIIDNNSSDNTSLIVQKWQKNHSNIKYVKNIYNIGGNANIMKAFYDAKKEYVWVLADNDSYNWNSWAEVEKAVLDKKDAIMVSTYEIPKLDIAQFFIQTTFLPAVIYKTSLIDNEVMGNMAYNISNMFPHLALSSKLINEKKDIYIVNNAIVDIGDNTDEKIGEYIYTRGYKESCIHPLMNDMNWMTGYANSLYLITDKKVRNYLATHNLFYMSKFNSAEVFFLNAKLSNGSLFNLLSIFAVLNIWSKIQFLFNWFFYCTIFKIIYIYSEIIRPDDNGYIYKQYRIIIFNLIKTKLFKIKIKLKKGTL